MNPYLLLGGAIVLETIGTTLMKSSNGFTRLWPSIGTAIFFVASFFLLSQTLKQIPTGLAYAIWSGCGIVLISTLAWIVHGQRLDLAGFFGIGLIVSGVVVLNVFSKTSAH